MLSIVKAVTEKGVSDLGSFGKEQALLHLAHEIAAQTQEDAGEIVADVLTREQVQDCGIGLNVACPHTRILGDGPLACAIGWSEKGLDYGARDRQRVHLVIMYRIPLAKRAVYLVEMAAISRALLAMGAQSVATIQDRNRFVQTLLDQSHSALPKSR